MDADQQRAVAAILKHDLESTGAELVYYFVHELGIAEREAWQVVIRERKEYLAAHPQDESLQYPGAFRELKHGEAAGLRRLA